MKKKKLDTNQPLEIDIDASALNAKFSGVLDVLEKFEPQLPQGILTPALGGDPVEEEPDAPAEPVYNPKQRANIQGNTIPGFNKDHQHFLFYRIRKVDRALHRLRRIT